MEPHGTRVMFLSLIYLGSSIFGEVASNPRASMASEYPLLVSGHFRAFETGYGFVNRHGDWVIRPIYSEAGRFSEGFARVRLERDDNYGLIGRDGKWTLLSDAFSIEGDVHDGLARATIGDGRDRRTGFVDLKGAWVIPPNYEILRDFREGLALAKIPTGKWGAIDRNGAARVPFNYDYLEGPADGAILFVVRREKKIGYLNKAGDVIVTPSLDDGKMFADGVAAAKQGGKWGLIDKAGRWLVSARFIAIGSDAGQDGFPGGLIPVGEKVNDETRFGYIDKSGSWVLGPRFVDAGPFISGFAKVATMSDRGKRWGCIDRSGRVIVNPAYSVITVVRCENGPVFWAHDEPWPAGHNYYLGADGHVLWSEKASHETLK